MTDEYHLIVSCYKIQRFKQLTWPEQLGRGMVGLPPILRQLGIINRFESAYLQPGGVVSQQPSGF
jgi:hypothetical protein